MLGGTVGLVVTLYGHRGVGSSASVFVACALIGLAQGLGMFYRFAALEVCQPSRKPLAVTLVLSGGVIAAFAGPQLAIATRHFGSAVATIEASLGPSPSTPLPTPEPDVTTFVGSFGAIVVLHLLNAILSIVVCLPRPTVAVAQAQARSQAQAQGRATRAGADGMRELLLENGAGGEAVCAAREGCVSASARRKPPLPAAEASSVADGGGHGSRNGSADGGGADAAGGSGRAADPLASGHPQTYREPLLSVVCRPRCLLAILIAVVAQTEMVTLMSPLAISMRDDQFAQSTRTLTYELHFAAMYAPGLLTSALIRFLGLGLTSTIGVGLLAGSCAVLSLGSDSAHYIGGMSLCGAGWNLCFSSATLLLDESYEPADANRVQALNDFLVFTVAAVGSFGSGYLYDAHGWHAVVLSAAVAVGLMVPLLVAHGCLSAAARRRGRGRRTETSASTADAIWAAEVTAAMVTSSATEDARATPPHVRLQEPRCCLTPCSSCSGMARSNSSTPGYAEVD
jgi:hypothetical protein